MRSGMMAFQLIFGVVWLVVLVVTVRAFAMGGGDAGAVFVGEFQLPWPAQFNTDLVVHALLAASWMIYRARSWAVGLLWAVLAIAFGSLFTLAYVLIAAAQARGDATVLLLGRHAAIASQD